MNAITTHVLDVARGRPATDVPVTLEILESGHFKLIGSTKTDADGRARDLLEDGTLLVATYRMTFDTKAYFVARKVEGFYPEVVVVFSVRDAAQGYHVPLLLSPYGYSTYRGS